jgi:hypothetical protein
LERGSCYGSYLLGKLSWRQNSDRTKGEYAKENTKEEPKRLITALLGGNYAASNTATNPNSD